MKSTYIKTTVLSLVGVYTVLASSAISGEITKSVSSDNKVESVKVAEDPAVTLITTELLNPIIQQSNRQNRFSRVLRPSLRNYELVEETESATSEARIFHIVLTTEKTAKTTEEKQSMSIVHKVKYLNNSHEFLVNQGDDWVATKDHKFLSLLPKSVKTDKTAAK